MPIKMTNSDLDLQNFPIEKPFEKPINISGLKTDSIKPVIIGQNTSNPIKPIIIGQNTQKPIIVGINPITNTPKSEDIFKINPPVINGTIQPKSAGSFFGGTAFGFFIIILIIIVIIYFKFKSK